LRRTPFWLSLLLVIAAAIVALSITITSASAQTKQTPQMAYATLTCCPLTGGACNAFCDPGSLAYSFIVTPFGQTNGPNDTESTCSAGGTDIAFPHSGDIFVMGAGGSLINITNTGNNWAPAWSPDGARIVFASSRDSANGDLYLMNPDGSNVSRLTYNIARSIGHTAWSPDGGRIAFNCEVDSGNSDICAINADGTGFVRLNADPAADVGPTWSPDSAQIAFATGRYGSNLEIATMNADGSGVSQVGTGIIGSEPAWSPDGAQIAFDASDSDGYPEIYLIQPDGTNVSQFGSGGYGAGWPAWFPMRVPVATFKFTCNGTACSFDASGSKDSYGTITSYAWNFGDQATGTGSSVTHTYASGGSYTARLTVTDSNDATGTKFQTIAINPVASFTFSCSGLTCNFDASGSTDSSGTITSYAWNFGDGGTGAGVTVSHTYAVGNSYNVTLTVTDSTGGAGTQVKTLYLNTPPIASFTFTCNLLTCSFNGSGSRDYDGTITNYAWNFGDSTAASGPTASHTYTAGGHYNVTLTVTDNAGATNVQSQTVIANSPPVASFTFSCNRFTCSYDASASKDSDGTITNYAWNFGDGTTLTGSYEFVGHTYPAPGTYTVTLTVTDNAGSTGAQSNSVTVVRRK
jgi:PKD repeat protein